MNFRIWSICMFLLLVIFQKANAQTYNVTFSVDMNGQSGFTVPELNGTFNNWCGNCVPMSDSNDDGIWEVVTQLAAGTYQYKFSADNWAMQENLVPGSTCTVTNSGFTNRSMVVSRDTILPVVCWSSCVDCAQTPNYYNVTFQLDMNGQTDFTTPEVNGTFNAWCGNCTPMTDANGDNIWEVTVYLQEGNYEYIFSYDNWTGQEVYITGTNCIITNNGGFTQRTLNVNTSLTLPPVCWGSCDPCGQSSGPYNITFQLDMSQAGFLFTTPEVNGTFNNWCGNCNPMSDEDGDQIWTLTIPLPVGNHTYKFSYDNWAGAEELTIGSTCTITENGFTNRFLQVSDSNMTVNYCFNSCQNSCTQSGCMDVAACNYNAAALLDNGSCLYTGNGCNDNNPGTMNDVISDQCLCNGITIIQGCTNELACNFNPMANVENNACLFTGNACNDHLIATINDVITASCVCSGTPTDLNGNNENTYQGVFYQAVARNANGTAMVNQNVNVRFSLHQGAANGSIEYQETHQLTTNAQGLFSTTFGQGQPQSGSYAQIQWGVNSKFLEVEFESNGWQTIGTQQLMAVPYAIRAKEVEPSGIKYQSPNGSCFVLQVNDAGQIFSVPVPCD